MPTFAIARMYRRPLPSLLACVLLAGGAGPRPRSGVARYIVTASPIDIGLRTSGLCIAVDPLTRHGVWWWEPGASGCATRSTGPGVFKADQATVSHSTRSPAISVRFQLPLHSATRPFVEVLLIIEDDSVRAVASGSRVPIVRRNNLDVPLVAGSLDRTRRK